MQGEILLALPPIYEPVVSLSEGFKQFIEGINKTLDP